MKIKIYSIGKVKQQFIKDAEKEYLKRFPAHFKIEFIELPVADLPEEERKKKEAVTLLSKIKPGEYLFILDENGEEFKSKVLSEHFSQLMTSGKSQFVFAIGGAYGFDQTVMDRADTILSLSKLTFPYQLARLILLEQLYRIYTIQSGIDYHK